MESPDNSRDCSPKRSEGRRSPDGDDKEQPIYIKFLVSNLDAGCVIGRGGSTITEFQSLSGARIQLSRNHEFFPGTSERIIMISGVIDEIMKATELILGKLADEATERTDTEIKSKVRLIVPNNSCGGIIGKGGSTIKSLVEDSHAGIKISPQDNNFIGLNDRIVTITGSLDERLHAIHLIMSNLIEDAHYSLSAGSPYSYAGVNFSGVQGIPFGYLVPSVPYSTANHIPNGVRGKYPTNKGMMSPLVSSRSSPGASEGRGISVTIGVADEHIGAVVGRGGRNIMEIIQLSVGSTLRGQDPMGNVITFWRVLIVQTSGARVKISERSDFIPGTSDRKVTITGSREAICVAEDMIMRKVSSVSES